jgi:hypothetical protein
VEADTETNINRAGPQASAPGKLKVSKRANNEEVLRAKAGAYARQGNFKNYCETLIELGDWDAALAIAPAVSEGYWNSLCKTYAQQLNSAKTGTVANGSNTGSSSIGSPSKQASVQVNSPTTVSAISLTQTHSSTSTFHANPEKCVPYMLAVDMVPETVRFYLDRRDTDSALVVAKMLGGIVVNKTGSNVEYKSDSDITRRSGVSRVRIRDPAYSKQEAASVDEADPSLGLSTMSIQLTLGDNENNDRVLSRHGSLTTFLGEGENEADSVTNNNGNNDNENKLLLAMQPNRSTHNPHIQSPTDVDNNSSGEKLFPAQSQTQTQLIAAYAADMYLDSSRPILAAATYISVGEVHTAIEVLTAANELDLAYAVATVFSMDSTSSVRVTDSLIVNFAAKIASLKGGLPIALDMLNNICVSGGSASTRGQLSETQREVHKGLMVSRFCAQSNQARLLYAQFSVHPTAYWLSKASEHEAVGDVDDAVTCYIIARDYLRAVQVYFIV